MLMSTSQSFLVVMRNGPCTRAAGGVISNRISSRLRPEPSSLAKPTLLRPFTAPFLPRSPSGSRTPQPRRLGVSNRGLAASQRVCALAHGPRTSQWQPLSLRERGRTRGRARWAAASLSGASACFAPDPLPGRAAAAPSEMNSHEPSSSLAIVGVAATEVQRRRAHVGAPPLRPGIRGRPRDYSTSSLLGTAAA